MGVPRETESQWDRPCSQAVYPQHPEIRYGSNGFRAHTCFEVRSAPYSTSLFARSVLLRREGNAPYRPGVPTVSPKTLKREVTSLPLSYQKWNPSSAVSVLGVT